MLATLNTLLRVDDPQALANRVLWHDDGDGSVVSLVQVQQALAAIHAKIKDSSAERWLLYTDDTNNFLVGFLVLLGLNRKVVISASRKPEWLQSLSNEFDAILSDEEITVYDETQITGTCIPCFDFTFSAGQTAPLQLRLNGAEQIVFYTSGSTGEPKAIAKTLLALTNEVTTIGKTFPDNVRDAVFMASVSHLHIYGLLFKVLLPLLVGGSGFKRQVDYPEQLLGLLKKFHLETRKLVFISSPAFLSRLDLQLPPVKTAAVFSSGGPLPHAAALDAQHYFSHLPIEVYGSTETGGIGYRQQVEATMPWTPFAGVQLTESEAGIEILSTNMPGQSVYLLDDQLAILANGQFLMKGRKDRIVKIGEKRIALAEIEQFLCMQPTISQCIALLIRGKRDVIGCAVVLSEAGKIVATREGQRKLIEVWKAAMRNRFEAITIPRQWRVLAALPVNSQSKIDNVLLIAEFAHMQDSV